ncbi:hypothetical protein E8E14_005157 [Neopestalotiopsis sp. 37M]|nr:hypothetical protein E8E14_005157 [Neopestalotiopsis sp. 37M]
MSLLHTGTLLDSNFLGAIMEKTDDWDGKPHWERDPEVAEKYIQYVDCNVELKLPDGVESRTIVPHGASFWTRTAKITTIRDKGSFISYFLKVSIGDDGKAMMRGEFESMKTLHNTVPALVPKPIAWGTYKTDKNIHFFLCTSCDMSNELCSLDTFPKMLAELHQGGVSPNGKFGFPVVTYQGRLAQDPKWCDTWEEAFSRNIDIYFEHELKAQGPDEEIANLRGIIMKRVIPRLLRPMETEGRSLTPRLIHGDLWEGNAGTDKTTALPKIYDACSWYAHHEFEMAPWRPARQKMGKAYVEAYLKHFPPSDPVEDFDGRNALYALRFNLCSSGLYPGNLNYREVVRNDLRELVLRYPKTCEEWASQPAGQLQRNEKVSKNL